MRGFRSQLWHRLGRRQLAVLGSIAALDGALLFGLGVGILSARRELVLLLAPTYSALFLVLAGSLAALADRARVSWPLVATIMVLGPLGAALLLRLCRRPPRG
jgi:hypothetical protein